MDYLDLISATTNTWMHFAIVYRGPNKGEGFTVYHDGINKGSDTSKNPYSFVMLSGVVKIGRWCDEPGDLQYGSVYLDELLFFNHQLNLTEVNMIMSLV